ncbi:hypothetical protein DIDNDMLP_00237 [Klebsiella phage KP13-7]|nr:hypothetical protein DIDNDMLP_00237 [Klebsiella phage KP13-7]
MSTKELNVTTNTYKTLGGRLLRDYYAIEIEERELPEDKHYWESGVSPLLRVTTSKHVFFTSRIHVNKRVELTFSFSGSYKDHEILNDRIVINKFIQMYGVDSFA